jgi:GNAT superfamily N-acetyltransferase
MAFRRLIHVRIGSVVVRPLTAADAEAVLALLCACDIADLGEVDVEMTDVEETWAGVDLPRCGRFAPGAGYALRDGDFTELYVHPDHRGAGLEEELLDFLEPEIIEVPERNTALRDVVAGRGYTFRHALVRMGIDLAEPPPAPRWPDGFAPRAFRPGVDDDAVLAVIAPGMREVGGSERLPSGSAFAPHASIVVEDAEGVAAAATTELWDGGARGMVRQLAVRPERRGRGLGAATLSAVLTAIRATGAADAVLGVHENNPNARRLYERAGMTPRFRVERWTRS